VFFFFGVLVLGGSRFWWLVWGLVCFFGVFVLFVGFVCFWCFFFFFVMCVFVIFVLFFCFVFFLCWSVGFCVGGGLF